MLKGGCNSKSLNNPGIDFYSGFMKNGHGGGEGENRNPKKNPGIDFNRGLRKNAQGGGVQFEILSNPGIDCYNGFRKTSQRGVQFEILKKCAPSPLTSKPGSATELVIIWSRKLHNLLGYINRPLSGLCTLLVWATVIQNKSYCDRCCQVFVYL